MIHGPGVYDREAGEGQEGRHLGGGGRGEPPRPGVSRPLPGGKGGELPVVANKFPQVAVEQVAETDNAGVESKQSVPWEETTKTHVPSNKLPGPKCGPAGQKAHACRGSFLLPRPGAGR
jgi:hypothetical protein